ncbi:MAG TPA: ABC transporter permease [Pseudonocardiaceae bacterium]|nr:ABC transporter permease [Pseudonocardiaceae bacterium]
MAALAFINRNLLVYRHTWGILVASVLEPLLYLVSIGVGVGHLIGTLPGLNGVSYPEYVAPALLATAAMNAAVNETTFSAYTRLHEENVYHAILRTPSTTADLAIGEIGWGAARGALSGTGFLLTMAVLGLVRTPLALLAIPAAALTGASFGALGLLVMTFLRNWHDFQLIQLFMLPMFLFSATFYPITVYPPAIQLVVRVLPLYPSTDLLRGVTLDDIGPSAGYALAYLILIGALAWYLAARRLRAMLIR